MELNQFTVFLDMLSLIRRISQYGLIAIGSGVVNFTIFAYLLLTRSWLESTCIAFIFSTIFNYVVSIKTIFISGARFKQISEVSYIFLISLAGLLFNLSLMYLFIEKLALHPYLSWIFSNAAVFTWNFLLRNYYVFKKK